MGVELPQMSATRKLGLLAAAAAGAFLGLQGIYKPAAPQPEVKIASVAGTSPALHGQPSKVEYTLRRGSARSLREAASIIAPPGAEFVRLQVVLEKEPSKRYAITLRNLTGARLLKQTDLPSWDSALDLVIPAHVFDKGTDFAISVTALLEWDQTEELGEYYFRVSKQ